MRTARRCALILHATHPSPELLECVECGELLLDDPDDEDAVESST